MQADIKDIVPIWKNTGTAELYPTKMAILTLIISQKYKILPYRRINIMCKNQDEEILSIKERTFSIKLSDADVERLYEKTGKAGLTVSELFENFVGDLVCGTYSNGSDERMYANDWFDRCWFSMGFGDMSFLQWLIENDSVEDALTAWDDLQDARNDLKELHAHGELDEDDKEDEETFKDTIAYDEKILNDLFSEYKGEERAIKNSTLESEMEKVIQWHEQKEKMKGSVKNA